MPEDDPFRPLADTSEMIAQGQRTIAAMQAHRDVTFQNLNLYVVAATEHLKAQDAAIQKKAEEIYHLESIRLGRKPPPAPMPGASPFQGEPASPPRSPGPEMGARPSGPIPQADTITYRDPQTGLPVTSRLAPGFPVTAPESAKATPEFKQWEGQADPRWSAADVIDEHGARHVKHNGRHLIFDATSGRLLSDEPMQKNGMAPAPPNGAA
jgi:hypothetical protein